jgi:hypothetical protein
MSKEFQQQLKEGKKNKGCGVAEDYLRENKRCVLTRR